MPGRFFIESTANETASVKHLELWQDFRDLYGIVWAKRVMDRVNQFAVRENWSVELSLDGFQDRSQIDENRVSTDVMRPVDAVPDRALHILCWILRRFVDQQFLRRYLPETSLKTSISDE